MIHEFSENERDANACMKIESLSLCHLDSDFMDHNLRSMLLSLIMTISNTAWVTCLRYGVKSHPPVLMPWLWVPVLSPWYPVSDRDLRCLCVCRTHSVWFCIDASHLKLRLWGNHCHSWVQAWNVTLLRTVLPHMRFVFPLLHSWNQTSADVKAFRTHLMTRRKTNPWSISSCPDN